MKKTISFPTWITVMILAAALFLPGDLLAQGWVPEFSLKDLQGKTFRLKDYKGKVVLLIFGATWCPSCREEIPHFKKLFETYTPRGLEVAYVNIQESQEKVSRFSAKHQLPYRTLLDMNGEVADAYNIRGVPAMILVRNGMVLTRNYRLVDSYLEKLFPK